MYRMAGNIGGHLANYQIFNSLRNFSIVRYFIQHGFERLFANQALYLCVCVCIHVCVIVKVHFHLLHVHVQLLVWNSSSPTPVLRYSDHSAAIKAITWSPHQHGILASGGGTADRTIRFWNTITGQPLQVVDTGSQVSVS